jgi:hypothetical protein
MTLNLTVKLDYLRFFLKSNANVTVDKTNANAIRTHSEPSGNCRGLGVGALLGDGAVVMSVVGLGRGEVVGNGEGEELEFAGGVAVDICSGMVVGIGVETGVGYRLGVRIPLACDVSRVNVQL